MGLLDKLFKFVDKEPTKKEIEKELNLSKKDIEDIQKDMLYQWDAKSCNNFEKTLKYLEEEGSEVEKECWDRGICPDCLGRDEEVGTKTYFEAIGFPKSGFSVCGIDCNCIIVGEDGTEIKI